MILQEHLKIYGKIPPRPVVVRPNEIWRWGKLDFRENQRQRHNKQNQPQLSMINV